MLPLIAMCDRWDIGGLSTNFHPQTGGPTIFIYDGHPGGIGITRTAFARFEELCGDAHRLIAECPCCERLPLVRAVAEVRQPQRAALEGAARCALLERLLGARRARRRSPRRSERARRSCSYPTGAMDRATRHNEPARARRRGSCLLNTVKSSMFALVLAAPRSSRARRPRPKPPPTQSLIFEGPGGRTPLTTLDAAQGSSEPRPARSAGRAAASAASTVSLPNVVNPTPYKGRAGGRNYEGSVAWYRTSFTRPSAGIYALGFQSANYQRDVWVDGHALGSHRGSYLPFEMRPKLAAGTRTRRSCASTGATPRGSRSEGFHRTWFNWGGLDGEVDVRRIGESELSTPTVQTTLDAGRAGRRRRRP